MKQIAQALASQGRNGDTELIHVTKPELEAVKRLSVRSGLGSLPVNPHTGLHEASLLGAILPIVGAVAGSFIPVLGTAAGAAVGGALGGAAGAKVDNRNMLTGAAMGGVGGYVGAGGLNAAPATAAEGATIAPATQAAMENYSALGAEQAGTQTIGQTGGQAVATQAAPVASQASAAQGANSGIGSFAPQQTADQATLAGTTPYSPTGVQPSDLPPVNPTGAISGTPTTDAQLLGETNMSDSVPSSTTTTIQNTPSNLQAAADWVKKNPMAAYVITSGGIKILAPAKNPQRPTHGVYMAGASHSGMTQNNNASAAPGHQANYFSGNSLYNYTQDPGTTVQRYDTGGQVAATPAPKYTMQDTTGAGQQYRPGTPAAAAPLRATNIDPGAGWGGQAPSTAGLLQAAPLAGQTITYGQDAKGVNQTYTLDAPTTTDWYANAAKNSPTNTKIQADAVTANPTGYTQYQTWQQADPKNTMSFTDWLAANPGSAQAALSPTDPNYNSDGQYLPAGSNTASGKAGGPISSLRRFAPGGITQLPPTFIRGHGDGMSDSIPAQILGTRKAPPEDIKVADGEYIVPADVVAHLGNGSTNAGAKHLDKTMAKIRTARTGTAQQGKQIKPEKFI